VTTFWFVVLAVLWGGFLILEGFDFGVGALQRVVGANDEEQTEAVNTIAPVWDGNEVWLVVAGAATFAAFPVWYGTMFSGMYLAFVLLLVALILRGVAIIFRTKHESVGWRRNWTNTLAISSLVAPLVVGIGLANLLSGLPIDGSQEFTGTFWTLFRGYPVLTGVTLLLLTLFHGAAFLMMRTHGVIRDRSVRWARRLGPITAVAVTAMAIWTYVLGAGGVVPAIVGVAAVLAILAAVWFAFERRDSWAFTATTVSIALAVAALFTNLYPRVMVSSLGSQFDLTITNTSSAAYSLKIMTIVLAIFLPVVLIYQGWTYYVFRRRLIGAPVDPAASLRNAADPAAE